MTNSQLCVVGEAVVAWAEDKGMKPIGTGFGKPSNGNLVVALAERYTGDPCVPDVDYLVWSPTHPGSVSGYMASSFNGKPSNMVRGGWVDFICPITL